MEFGQLRSMQSGPVGDAPQFSDMGKEKLEGEAVWGLERTFGNYLINEDSDSRTAANGVRSRVAVGGAFAPTKQFHLSGYIDATLASDYDENQTRGSYNSKYDGGLYRHELALFGIFNANPIVVGGGIGMLVVGAETKDSKFNYSETRVEVGSAVMPVLRLFGGISLKEFDGTIGFRTFSKGTATTNSQDAAKNKREYDTTRRNPGEVDLDARINFATGYVAGSVAYVLTGQASEQVDEFSTRYVTSGGKTTRVSGLGRYNDDTIRAGIGGRFDPVKMFGILTGVTYTTASMKKPEYASNEQDNLGGIRFDLGTEVTYQKFRGMLDFGYTLDETVSYTVKDGDRSSSVAQDRTLKPAQNPNDKVKMTQGKIAITLGGGIAI